MGTWLRRWISVIVGDALRKALIPLHTDIQRLRTQMSDAAAIFEAAVKKLNDETTRIGTYVQSILAQLNRTDLTPDEEAALKTALGAVADRLTAIGATPTDPVPVDAPILPEVASTETV